MRWFIAILLVSACGKAPITTIDPELQSYVDNFAAAGNLVVPAMYIHFGSLQGSPEDGECDVTGSYREITIDTAAWEEASEVDRTMLMFHELGHCVLNRVHNTTVVAGLPVSIMYPIATAGDLEYEQHPKPYMEELFGRAY